MSKHAQSAPALVVSRWSPHDEPGEMSPRSSVAQRARRSRGVLALVLIAGVLLMHVWTDASGEHMAAPGGTMPATVVDHQPGEAHLAVGTAASPVLAVVSDRMPAMAAMSGSCAAVLLATLLFAVPLSGVRARIRRAVRRRRCGTSAVGPPPDLNLRFCVLRT